MWIEKMMNIYENLVLVDKKMVKVDEK